jgi:hypothetical protein
VDGQCRAPAARPPGKDPVPVLYEAGWAPGPVSTGTGTCAPPPGFDPFTAQPIASWYTSYAVLTHEVARLPPNFNL